MFAREEEFMKILFALVLFLLVAAPALAELTPEDIRIIREEVTAIVKAESADLEKRMQAYVDLKFEVLDTKFTTKLSEMDTKFTTKFEAIDKRFEAIDKQFAGVDGKQNIILIFVTGLIGLIVLAIGVPQIIMALRQKDYRALEAEIKSLQEKIKLLEETQLVKPQ